MSARKIRKSYKRNILFKAEINVSEGLTLGQSKIGLLAYMDDITISSDNIEIVIKHCNKLMDASSKIELIINDKKQNT